MAAQNDVLSDGAALNSVLEDSTVGGADNTVIGDERSRIRIKDPVVRQAIKSISVEMIRDVGVIKNTCIAIMDGTAADAHPEPRSFDHDAAVTARIGSQETKFAINQNKAGAMGHKGMDIA